MDLKDAPYSEIKVYDIDPRELNKFTLDQDKVMPMFSPNFKEFNDVFTRASTGLCAKKKYEGTHVCFKRIGIVGYSSSIRNRPVVGAGCCRGSVIDLGPGTTSTIGRVADINRSYGIGIPGNVVEVIYIPVLITIRNLYLNTS